MLQIFRRLCYVPKARPYAPLRLSVKKHPGGHLATALTWGSGRAGCVKRERQSRVSVIATCKRFVRCAQLVGSGYFHNNSGRVAVEEFRTYGAPYILGIIDPKLRAATPPLHGAIALSRRCRSVFPCETQIFVNFI